MSRMLSSFNLSQIELKAHAAWDEGDLVLAFNLFSDAAHRGSASCMLSLGYFYDEGLATGVDKKRAMYWYKKAYRLGSSAAASNIAILHREQARLRLMVSWWRRAIRLGDGDAELELAKCLIAGQGVRKSLSAAKQLLCSALASTHICPAGWEEAEALLRQLPEC